MGVLGMSFAMCLGREIAERRGFSPMTVIRAIVPQVASPAESNKGLANLHDYLNDVDAAPTGIHRCDEGNCKTNDLGFKHPGRRGEPKGYLHLHMKRTSRKKALPSS